MSDLLAYTLANIVSNYMTIENKYHQSGGGDDPIIQEYLDQVKLVHAFNYKPKGEDKDKEFADFNVDAMLLTGGVWNNPTYLDVVTNGNTIRNVINSLAAVGSTNWDAALQAMNVISGVTGCTPDLMYFITDGQPTVNQGTTMISTWSSTNTTSGSTRAGNDLAEAIAAASDTE